MHLTWVCTVVTHIVHEFIAMIQYMHVHVHVAHVDVVQYGYYCSTIATCTCTPVPHRHCKHHVCVSVTYMYTVVTFITIRHRYSR